MPQVYVCPLSRIAETVARSNASHLVSLINDSTPVPRPDTIPEANHLFLGINDIVEPMDGLILPATEHVERLVDFIGLAPGPADRRPLLCRDQPLDGSGLHHPLHPQPERDEADIALRMRAASRFATPNMRGWSRSATTSSAGMAGWSTPCAPSAVASSLPRTRPLALGLEA
jgi:predicted protein tyrosine phosphatase